MTVREADALGRAQNDTSERRRTKAVLLAGPFSADTDHIAPLSRSVDLTVYGSTKRLGYESFAPRPPEGSSARTFNPIIRFKNKSILWIYPNLSKALTTDNPDVLHVISEPWGLLAVQAARWARHNSNTALVVHGCDQLWWHGPALEQHARKRLAKYTLTRADAFAGENSRAIERALENGLKPDSATAQIHTNPRNPELFRPAVDQTEQARVRRELGLPEGGTGIGFVGKRGPEKRPIRLHAPFRQARQRLAPNAWIAIAGEGPLRSALVERSASEGIHFLGRLSYPKDVSRLLRAVDIAAIPSYDTPNWQEQGPRVVLEAMLSGCAIVGSQGGAIPEILDGAGLVVPQKEVGPLSEALVEAEKLLPTGLGRRAREQALLKYSGKAVADQMLDLWQKSLAVRSNR